MQAFIFMTLVAAAVSMPYGLDNGWAAPAISHAPAVAYAQPAFVKQVQYQPQYVQAAPVVKQVYQPQYVQAAPVVKQVYQPQYVHAAPVVKAVAPATSYSTFTQTHVSHPQIVKVAQPVHYAQPIVKVAQPAIHTYVQQPQIVKQVVAQPVIQTYVQQPQIVKQVVAQPAVYGHASYPAHGW